MSNRTGGFQRFSLKERFVFFSAGKLNDITLLTISQ